MRISADVLALALTDGGALVIEERYAHLTREGWTAEHDDEHTGCELTMAAVSYASMAFGQVNVGCAEGDPIDDEPDAWPWDKSWWKPNPDPVVNLVKAGSLIIAEIDRLLRERA